MQLAWAIVILPAAILGLLFVFGLWMLLGTIVFTVMKDGDRFYLWYMRRPDFQATRILTWWPWWWWKLRR